MLLLGAGVRHSRRKHAERACLHAPCLCSVPLAALSSSTTTVHREFILWLSNRLECHTYSLECAQRPALQPQAHPPGYGPTILVALGTSAKSRFKVQ